MTSIEVRKQQLLDRRRELDARLHRIEDELDEPVSKDFEERATEREDEEVLEDLGAAGVRELRMVDAALKRIEDDSYGICVSCGDPISEERLDAVPQAPKCRNCAG
jgi:RNA polymerase-binding transcription factor DksA